MAVKTIQASGSRKRAIARAVLKPGTGRVSVNAIPIDKIEPYYMRLKMQEPLLIAGDAIKKADIKISVNGGGMAGQAEAVRLVIARVLSEYKMDLKEVFLAYDRNLLVADSRYKETRKPNTHGKARSKRQKSYR